MTTAKRVGYVCHMCKTIIPIDAPIFMDTRPDRKIKFFHASDVSDCYRQWCDALEEDEAFKQLELKLEDRRDGHS